MDGERERGNRCIWEQTISAAGEDDDDVVTLALVEVVAGVARSASRQGRRSGGVLECLVDAVVDGLVDVHGLHDVVGLSPAVDGHRRGKCRAGKEGEEEGGEMHLC